MSYVIPSVLVYQQLENSGGVLNSTPDLEACIIGPLNNIVEYVPGSIASAVKTAALSATTTTGSITSGSTSLTGVAAPGSFSEGQSILVLGAGTSGGNLQATISTIAGNVFTLDTAAGTTVTDATVTGSGKITAPTSPITFGLNSDYPGQLVDSSSVKVWLNNTKVETASVKAWGYTSNNKLTFSTGSVNTTTGSTTTVINLAASGNPDIDIFAVGDTVTIPGVGVASATYTGTVTDVDSGSNALTVTPATTTTVGSGVAVTKVATSNVNSTTNTLRVEAGDTVKVTYTNTSAVEVTFSTTVKSVLTTSGANGDLTSIETADMFPTDMSASTTTTGSNAAAATTINLTSSAAFSIGDRVVIAGGGSNGADLETSVATVPGGTSITIPSPGLGATVTAGTVVKRAPFSLVSIWKTYNNQLLASTRPISGGSQIDTTNVGTQGTVTVQANSEVAYGKVMSADVYIGYTALRADQSGTVLTVNDISDAEGQFGDLTDANPLGLGVSIALANTVGRVRAVALGSNDLAGYLDALNLIEGERVYFITPLTQDTSILAAVKAHVDQMSTPEMASWRTAIVNTAIPTTKNIGSYTADVLNSNSGNNAVTNISGFWTLTSSNSTFISDGVVPGDMLNISAGGGLFDSYEIDTVVSNQQVTLTSGSVSAQILAVDFYVSRTLTKTQQAQAVAATSEQFNDKRVWHVQPDYVGVTVDGVIKKLPGYYLCCGLAGMGAGFPVQQGFTNIGVAGISDLYNSNYYFSRTDLNAMAEKGTLLFVQATQKGIPYVRHELTTDISVLEYREVLVVKNWDFLSYYYHDKLSPFIGSWNITSDTMNIIRQTIVASSELLITKKLPKIGPPLLGYTINSIAQDANNKDNLNVNLQIQVVYPLNYLNLYLVI